MDKSIYNKLIIIPVLVFFIRGQALDPRFHSYPEIQTMLDSLSSIMEYQDIFRVDTIGYSQRDQLPILAVKISDNVMVKEDEPRVLFLGQVHAEEVLGVEAVLELIMILLDPPPSMMQHVFILRSELETWIVPSYNPEGMSVVYSGLDVSYRKNKHDFSPEGPWPNGIFDYDPSIGNDVDGVDINRNFDFNWMFGEDFLVLDPSPYGAHYDYFKGLAPFSEPETRAVRDLALENDFLFSIAWHSSRSGNLSEKVFYPWSWHDKVTPDDGVISSIGETLAGLLENESGQGTYLHAYGGSRNGKAHDWFYTATGCIQYLIECGTSNLQPDSLLIEETVERLLPGMIYLMDRSIGYYSEATQITGTVTDGGTPLEDAEVKIIELSSTVQEPRLTDEFGRFRRIVEPGTYSLVVSKPGYYSDTLMVTANFSTITSAPVNLEPKPEYSISLNITGASGTITSSITGIFTSSGISDTVNLTEGLNTITLFEGDWQTLVLAEEYQPWIGTITSSYEAEYQIFMATPVYTWSLELADSIAWDIRQGPWDYATDTLKSQSQWLYPNSTAGQDTFMLVSPNLNITGTNRLALSITHRYELEWDRDLIAVLIFNNSDSMIGQWQVADQQWENTITTWIGCSSISLYDSVRVALKFCVDGSINYRGWQIFGLELTAALYPDMSIRDDNDREVNRFLISNPYPNPSNGMVGINLSGLPGPVTITVYDLLGRQVYHEIIPHPVTKLITWQINFGHNGYPGSSGLYFMRIKTPQHTIVKKCIILKN